MHWTGMIILNNSMMQRGRKRRQFWKKMTLNPWWHGYWQKKLGDTRQYTVNYVASYVYITRLANAQKYDSGAPAPDGMTATVQSNIVSDVNSINWASGDALGKKNPTAGEKRAFIWGMAMHTLADTFAHSAYRNVNGSYHAITHTGKYPGADDTNTIEKRFEDDKEAVSLAMNVYTASNHPNGTYAQFSPVTKEKKKGNEKMENYKLGNIYRYVEDVSDAASARSFSLCNHNISAT